MGGLPLGAVKIIVVVLMVDIISQTGQCFGAVVVLQ